VSSLFSPISGAMMSVIAVMWCRIPASKIALNKSQFEAVRAHVKRGLSGGVEMVPEAAESRVSRGLSGGVEMIPEAVEAQFCSQGLSGSVEMVPEAVESSVQAVEVTLPAAEATESSRCEAEVVPCDDDGAAVESGMCVCVCFTQLFPCLCLLETSQNTIRVQVYS